MKFDKNNHSFLMKYTLKKRNIPYEGEIWYILTYSGTVNVEYV